MTRKKPAGQLAASIRQTAVAARRRDRPGDCARAAKARLKQFKIGAALYTWTNSRRYLAAVAGEGAVRWNLAGTAVDFVAREH